ncbi:MAG: hypothetical protein ACNS62_14850 [Candidatus Cyclobacteriaceae bacterium M3_2C_046]
MLRKIISFLLLLWLGVGNEAFSQVNRSPFTINGIGEVQGMGLASHMGIGGVGLSYGKLLNLNNLNPALLPFNSLTVFEVGMVGERRVIQRDSLNQENAGFNLDYLAFGFPIKSGRVTMSVGLKPYSIVDYNIQSIQNIANSSHRTEINYTGTGGMNQAYLAAGARFFRSLYFGARASYMFGSIIDETIVSPFAVSLPDTVIASRFRTSNFLRSSFSDFSLGLGMAYAIKITDNTYLNIGAIYDLKADIATKQHERLDRQDEIGQIVFRDTLRHQDERFVTLPAKYGIGISLQKGPNWVLAADFEMQDWTQFKGISGREQNLGESYRGGIGFEFIPDYTSVRSYWNRVMYKAGFTYEQTPFLKNNQAINEFGINFGVTLPVTNASSISMALQYSQRGENSGDLIKEDIYRLILGVTFNDKWFERRKFD